MPVAKQNVRIDKIRFEESTQIREMSQEHIADLVQAFEDNYDSIPPVVLFGSDETGYFIGDGWHRLTAAMRLKFMEIKAVVHPGGAREALFFAAGSNKGHGLRRSNKDKRATVMVLLNDPEWSKMSDRAIAEHCGVSRELIGAMRPSQLSEMTVDRRIGLDGKSRPAHAASCDARDTSTDKSVRLVGKTLVDGVLQDDPPEIAEMRQRGSFHRDAVPVVDTGGEGVTPEEFLEADREREAEREAIKDGIENVINAPALLNAMQALGN